MIHKILRWLLIFSFFFWLAPWHGKEFFPEVFGHWYIQWPCTIVTAILASIGVFLAYREFFSQDENKWNYCGFCCGFMLILGIQILIVLSADYMLSRVRDSITDFSKNEEVNSVILGAIYATDTLPDKSQELASAYYRMTGTIIPAKTTNGLEFISPTAEDIAKRQESINQKEKLKNTARILDDQLVQFPLIAGVYVAILILVFLSGTIILGFRRKKHASISI